MYRKPIILMTAFWLVISLCNCQCSDSLSSARGSMNLALCDQGEACGCQDLAPESSSIDFGTPAQGSTTRRTLRLENSGIPMPLLVESIQLDDPDNVFSLVLLQRFDSDAEDATSESVTMQDGGFVLEGAQLAELAIEYAPTEGANHTATLIIESNSDVRGNWVINLSGGAGTCDVCIESGECGDGVLVDFGTFNDTEVGPDFEDVLGRPVALGTQGVSVTNTGSAEVLVTVQLTNDGIPETSSTEIPGENGVFFLGEIGCASVAPGETLTVPVEYRPSTAGQHFGEVVVAGLGAPIYVNLMGRVIGPHICFETEDDVPDDATLQFGSAPSYTTAQNVSETRSITMTNCGYEAELTLDSITFANTSSSEFTSVEIPWTGVASLAVGESATLPIDYLPNIQNAIGANSLGRIIFETNDTLRPTSAVDLNARIGQPEQCVLIPSPSPVDFGWVATDEVGVGEDCDALPIPIPGCEELVSRLALVSFTNVGQRPCTDINLGALIPGPNSPEMFEYYPSNNAPAAFELQPGESFGPIELIFKRSAVDLAMNHFGKLPYTSAEGSSEELLLEARGGGSPNCSISFSPVSPATFFCPQESLAFGNVNIGQDKTMELKIINTGSEDCSVAQIALGSGTSSAFSWSSDTLPGIIPVNDFRTVDVRFEPVPPSGNNPFEEIPFLCGQNNIFFKTNSGPGGTIIDEELALAGNGTRPDIDVIPGEIDFGLVTVGCCSEWVRVAVYNSGDGTLDINSLGILGSSDPGFETTQPTSMTLPPGSDTEFEVRFCATAVGDSSGVVEIQSTDDNEEYFTVPMTAEGTLDSTGLDQFQQPERPLVDVLLAVDDSGSMSEEQQNLANNFSSFINAASALDTDYHIGVVNTDSESDWRGKLYSCDGNPLWVSDDQPVATQTSQFNCNVRVTNSGRPSSDSKESPLQAARLALDYPNIGDFNAGFYREDAKLYVILVTDEEDQSDGTAQLYVDFFRNLKGVGNPDLLNISAIAGPPPNGCDTAEGNQVDYDAVDAVGGQFRSICSADWSNMVGSLGLDVFNARRQFPLSRPATAGTITVEVCDDDGNGNPINCQTVTLSTSNGWSFDADTNSIIFNGNEVPGPSQHITVTYDTICYE